MFATVTSSPSINNIKNVANCSVSELENCLSKNEAFKDHGNFILTYKMTITSCNVIIMQGDQCHVLCSVKWPKDMITDNFNHTYQMKMVVIMLHAYSKQARIT